MTLAVLGSCRKARVSWPGKSAKIDLYLILAALRDRTREVGFGKAPQLLVVEGHAGDEQR